MNESEFMNAKKYIVVTLVLNIVLVAFAATYYHSWQAQCADNTRLAGPISGQVGKFGHETELVLPAATDHRPAGILDLETERILPQPAFDSPDVTADKIIGWIRTNGLDISASTWSNGAACVTYDMTVVAVEGKCWSETTEEELRANPALAPRMHSPRRQLILGPNRPDTYAFRTAEGTLGMLRLIGLSDDRSGVRIRYKLVNPNSNLTSSTIQ